MQIDALETVVVEVPLPKPIGTAIHQMRSVGCVLTTVRTTDGATGEGFAFTLNADRIRSFDEMIRGMAPYVVGEDVRNVERINDSIWRAINPTGHKGVTIAALSAIGVIDSAVRTPFLTFVPFLLIAKGAQVETVGFALALIFAGGAASPATKCGVTR